MCILQTQYFGISSIPKKLKKRQDMTFMMTSSNSGKSDICQFVYHDLFHIANTVYVQNVMYNGQKSYVMAYSYIWLYSMLQHIQKKLSPSRVKELGILLKFRGKFEKFLAACNSSKNTGLPQFFSNVSGNCILRASIS